MIDPAKLIVARRLLQWRAKRDEWNARKCSDYEFHAAAVRLAESVEQLVQRNAEGE